MFTETLTKRVLIVDDDPAMRDELRHAFSRVGYEVAVASSAEEALQTFHAAGDIQAVISDVHLPGGMGGPALVDQIHGRQPEIKAVLTTAYGGAVDYLEATRFREVDYMMKPLDLPRLVGLIETAIGRPVEMPSDYWLC